MFEGPSLFRYLYRIFLSKFFPPRTGTHRSEPPHVEPRPDELFYAGQVEKKLGYRFAHPVLIVQALKHRSYVYAREQSGMYSNERLEFLGDAVLDLIVSEHLYEVYPKRREGRLTQLRSSVVNGVMLAEQAQKMGLGRYLLLSAAEDRSGGRQRNSILADAYESVIGAMYLDGGIEPVRVFLQRTLLTDIRKVDTPYPWRNYKSILLEYTQSEGKGQPRYHVEGEEGPDHEKMFTIDVYVGGHPMGRGTGATKKDAEQNAAKDAATRLKLIPQES
ncbi:MAG: ribonuclease III [candidate division Zixibacteria bacterium]|nr:ribonuclease III [candidate division Zixibacteria bacterium]